MVMSRVHLPDKFNSLAREHTGKCICRFGGIYYRIVSFLSIRHAHCDLSKHLGIDSSTDLDDRYSNLFLNAYINRHAHTKYLKMIKFYSP